MTGVRLGTCDCCITAQCGIQGGGDNPFYNSGLGTDTECPATMSAEIYLPEITCIIDCDPDPCKTYCTIPEYSGSITITQDSTYKCKYASAVTSVDGNITVSPCSGSSDGWNNRRIEIWAQNNYSSLIPPTTNHVCPSPSSQYCCAIVIYIWDRWAKIGGGYDLDMGNAIGYLHSIIPSHSSECPCYNAYASGTPSPIDHPSVWKDIGNTSACCDGGAVVDLTLFPDVGLQTCPPNPYDSMTVSIS